MLEDLLELSTIEEAEPIFNYMEPKEAVWAEWGLGGQGTAKLAMLRFCNQLLKRLSRSQSGELCGRILIFCARWFPLNDRSGLNVQGLINTGHRTVVEEVEVVRTLLSMSESIESMLRFCNKLLKRLSRSQSGVLCGLHSSLLWPIDSAARSLAHSGFNVQGGIARRGGDGRGRHFCIAILKVNFQLHLNAELALGCYKL